MARVSILWDKPSDLGIYSGGSWVAGLPLANLVDPDLRRVARSTSATTANTRFRIDLGTARPIALNSFALLNHNMTTAARWRVVVTNSPTDADPLLAVLDTGLLNAWLPTVARGSLPWGTFPWDGVDIAAYAGAAASFYIQPGSVFARYIWVYMEDAANPAGFLDLGRFLAGTAWTPKINAAYGAGFRYVDTSEAKRTRGGRRIVVERPRYRLFEMTFEALTKDEALGTALEMERLLGKAGNFLLSFDAEEEGASRFRRTIYAAMTDMSPVQHVRLNRWKWSLTAEELI